MWPRKIAPYVGESDYYREPFAEWYQRVGKHIANVPEDVADQWLHENWPDSPYNFLPLEQLKFDRQRWSLAEIDRVKFGSHWGSNASDVNRLDHKEIRETPLAEYMLRENTWPRPIILLDNEHGLARGDEALGRWHLLEGHQRLTYMRCLQHKGVALAEHDVWVVTAPKNFVAIVDKSHNLRPDYAHEKLGNAIEHLVVGKGSIQERVDHVLRHGGISRVNRTDFPGDMRERWDQLVHAWKEPLDDRAAQHFAREVLEFYSWVCYRLGDWWLDDRREPNDVSA